MNIMVTGRHVELTEAIRAHIESGLEKVEQHFGKPLEANVVLNVEKDRHIAEVNLNVNGMRLHGKEVSGDMYGSIDAVIAKVDKQVQKYKDKLNRNHHNRLAKAEAVEAQAEALAKVMSSGETEESAPENGADRHIVRETAPMKPMHLEEAMLQFDLIDDHFLVFSNAENSRINVLYRRNDGDLGLIEPQF